MRVFNRGAPIRDRPAATICDFVNDLGRRWGRAGEPVAFLRFVSGLTIMRRLLTGGIKAILAIAALSTAAHWAMRIQREPSTVERVASALPDPVITGSIEPRRVAAPVEDVTRGLDQRRLSELIAGASPEKTKVQKAVAKR